MDDMNYAVVVAKVRNSQRDIVAHMCIADHSYQAAIASAYHDNMYFFLDKTDEMSSFRLSGIAEPQASVNPITNYDLNRLKWSYLQNTIVLLGRYR